MLKVSVIIPTYQRAKTLLNAVNSALAQTLHDIELIIVDDGSTDETRAVVQAIPDTRLQYHYQQNAGPAAARNTALHHATGEYVALLDSDDWWQPTKLEQQSAVLDAYPEIDVVFTDAENIDAENDTRVCFSEQERGVLERVRLVPIVDTGVQLNAPTRWNGRGVYRVEHPNLREIVYERNFIATSSLMFRRDVLLNVGGFNSQMFGTEDTDLLLRVLPVSKLAYIADVLAARHKDSTSLSWRSEKRLLEMVKFHQHYLNTDLRPLAERGLKHTYRSLARLYGRSGNLRKAAQTFRTSLDYGFDMATGLYTVGAVFGPLPFVLGGALSRWRSAAR